jgi:hypothetical protein
MTFLSTCCCGTTKAPPPPPTGCPDVCCNTCMSGDRITTWSGNPINLTDDLVLYQGLNVGTLSDINFNLTNESPAFKYEYKKYGSFWVWWNPSYMLNYTTNIPECESTEYVSASQFGGPGNQTSAPGNNLHKSRIMQGDACNHTLIPNAASSPPDANDDTSFSNNQTYYGGGGRFSAFFTTLKKGIGLGGNAYEDNSFTGVLLDPTSSGPSKESGYPCSTAAEDGCCAVLGIAQNAGYGSQQYRDYCNKMGVSPYRRRIMAQHYPWAWQIFAYNEGNPWPFILQVNYFNQNELETSPSGVQITGGFATPLRAQILGFIQCEHHWGLGEAGACNVDYYSEGVANAPLSFFIPRRFIYGCSAIPFFEFDVHEFMLDNPDALLPPEIIITNMRAFTAYFDNPIGNFGLLGPQPYPDENNTEIVRSFLTEMARVRFTNIITKDWRQEAYEEIIIAEQYFRESLGITGAQYDLFAALNIERPIPITGTVQDFRDLSTQRKDELIKAVFPVPLGPIRKRRRALAIVGLFDTMEENTLINVFMPFDVLGTGRADAPCLFRDENGGVVKELRDLQAMRYLNVFTEAFKDETWTTSYPLIDEVVLQRRKLSLVAKLSQITYTYMLAQPGRWDFSAWGRGIANGNPEDNWFYRKYGYVQGPTDTDFPSFSRVLAHSQLNRCSQTPSTATSNVDFAWNPGTHCLFEDCINPVTPTATPGLLLDPYCGRSTYSDHPDVFLATHSNGIKYTGEGVNCPGGGGSFPAIRPAGRSEVSFVRYKSRDMKWDTSTVPFKVVEKTQQEKNSYNNTTFRVPLTKTKENCTICYGRPCSSVGEDEFLYNRPEFKSFNASCAPSENVTSTATSDCAGVAVELNLTTAPQINYNNDNKVISYDFNWYGPIAFRKSNPYTLNIDQMFTVGGVTISNNCLEEYDFCEKTNRIVHNAITANGNEEQWPFGLPQQRYWEAAPTYGPYGISYSDFVGMFTAECCQLIEKCEDCGVSLDFTDKCLYLASRWCRSPKYPQEAIEAWLTSGIPNIEDFDFGQYSGVSGMVIGYEYGLNDPTTIDRRDLNPNTGAYETFNADNFPTNNALQFNSITEFVQSRPIITGSTWGICTPTNYGIAFTSDNQFDCSSIMFNVTEDQLRSIGMTNTNMIDQYKGSFCACEGIILDGAQQTASFNNECKAYNDGQILLANCVDPVLDTDYSLGELQSLLNQPSTQHQFICRYIGIALCGNVKLLGGGLVKFRGITYDAPCDLRDKALFNASPGVTCYDSNDYAYLGQCYVAPDPDDYAEPGGSSVYCSRFSGVENCLDSITLDTLDPNSFCCSGCLDLIAGEGENYPYDCGSCPADAIFVYDDPLQQTDNVQFANWAREQGLIGCWRRKT